MQLAGLANMTKPHKTEMDALVIVAALPWPWPFRWSLLTDFVEWHGR